IGGAQRQHRGFECILRLIDAGRTRERASRAAHQARHHQCLLWSLLIEELDSSEHGDASLAIRWAKQIVRTLREGEGGPLRHMLRRWEPRKELVVVVGVAREVVQR